jgi:hypothetical protein
MSSNINIIPGESVILFTSSTGNYNAVVQDNDGTLKFTGKTAYSGSATFYSASTNNTNQGIATLNSTTKNLELRDLKTIINREWKEITGTTYTTVAGDETKWLIATNAGGCRIDYNGNVFDDGDEIIVTQYGVGQVIVVSGPAPNTTTIESPTGFSNTREQYSTIFGKLYKTPNVLVLGGQLKDRPLTIVTETSERTFALGDENTKYFRFNKETPVTATVPKNSAVAFDIGSVITIEQQGAGVVTVAPVDGDVTINAFDELKTAGQYAVVKLIKVGTDVWTLIGGASGGDKLTATTTSTVTLTAAGWTAKSQTLTVTGVTASSVNYFVFDTISMMTRWGEAKVLATSQGTDSITFICDTTPTENIDFKVVILK